MTGPGDRRARLEAICPCGECPVGAWSPECQREHGGAIPLCPEHLGAIGGAYGGPDAAFRPAMPGEACAAAEHVTDEEDPTC